MAIPISEYISIANKVVTSPVSERDFSGLIFTGVAMKSGAPLKDEFEGSQSVEPKVVSITVNDLADNFSDTGFLAYATRYFGYTGGTRRATTLNLAYVKSGETAVQAYSRVTADFTNFGAFTFYGADSYDDIDDMAAANNANDYGWVFILGTDAESQATDAGLVDGQMMTHLTHADVEALAWYASVNYDAAGSAGTIDFKQFGTAPATITTKSAKTTADNLKVNYIGLVQNYGNGLKFYQKGVNMDGTDLGVVRDACWINHRIVSGYFALQTSLQKVPANYVGCSMVKGVIVDVALRAIDNGAILLEKPLTAQQVAAVEAYTNNQSAADDINNFGYYIDIKIVDTNKCQYTLVYAKGDHIMKVEGVNILV